MSFIIFIFGRVCENMKLKIVIKPFFFSSKKQKKARTINCLT